MDGDSCTLLADTGFRGRHLVRVRLLGYSAPERYAPGGPEATAQLRALLSLGAGPWPLRVITHQRETVVAEVTSFERHVASLYVVDAAGEMHDVATLLAAT